jgi:hypothetical protein
MRTRSVAIVFSFQALLAAPLAAQTKDYHLEETPAVSWNAIGFHDARLLSLGGVSLLASPPFAAAANPALIPTTERRSVALSGSSLRFEAMQYAGLNQGSLSSPTPPSATQSLASGVAGHLDVGRIGLSAGWYVNSLLRFPDYGATTYYSSYDNSVYDAMSVAFDGREDVFYAAAALPDWKGLRVGARLAYVTGWRELMSLRVYSYYAQAASGAWLLQPVSSRVAESHRTKTVAPSLGLSWQITRRWTVAGQVTWPLEGTADRSLTRTFQNPATGLVISDRERGSDPLSRPQEATLGTALALELSDRLHLRLGVEAAYVHWSGYRYVFFGEAQPRDLRDTLGLSGGAELAIRAARQLGLALRLGYRADPQPVREPATTLSSLSAGLGVRIWSLGLDGAVSRYQGSPGGVRQSHTVLALTLRTPGD